MLARFAFPIVFAFASIAQADEVASPVDRSQPLQLLNDEFQLADGPSWDGNSLIVPDVKAKTIRRWNSWAKNKPWSTIQTTTGRYSATVFALGRLYASNNAAGQIEVFAGNQLSGKPMAVHELHSPDGKPPRPNDLAVDSTGGIYYTLTPSNTVSYINPNGDGEMLTSQIPAPNGIVLSPDQKTLYVSAVREKKIYSMEVRAAGQLGPAQLFATLEGVTENGADGMTVDRAGNVYCVGPKSVWIWNPAGEKLDRIECPTRPINCTFGGKRHRTLFITGFGGLYAQPMKINGPGIEPPPVDSLRRNDFQPSTEVPDDLHASLNVEYYRDGNRRLLADFFWPKTTSKRGVGLVLIHGGGWLNGSKEKFRSFAIGFAKKGYSVMSVEYRLGGEAKFPAGIQDCNAATRFFKSNAAQYNFNPQRIVAVGGSAGGHLAGLMASGWKNPELQHPMKNDHTSRLALSFVLAGPMEMQTGSVARRSQPGMTSNATNWLGADIKTAPDLYANADAHAQISEDTCPIFFHVGSPDNPERNEPSRKELRRLNIATGVTVYPGAKHGIWNRLPWQTRYIENIDEQIQQHLTTE